MFFTTCFRARVGHWVIVNPWYNDSLTLVGIYVEEHVATLCASMMPFRLAIKLSVIQMLLAVSPNSIMSHVLSCIFVDRRQATEVHKKNK